MHSIYEEEILDHYKHPRNKGKMEKASAEAFDGNPICGDEFSMQILVDSNNVMERIMFDGLGCAISTASASILTETFQGKKVDEVLKMSNDEWVKELGVPLSLTRRKCALLGLKVLKLCALKKLGREEKIEI